MDTRSLGICKSDAKTPTQGTEDKETGSLGATDPLAIVNLVL